jgi:1,4-alpha-glucan branching enzyme
MDWNQQDQFRGIIRMYRDLIKLRLNQTGCSRGLCGQFTQVYHLNDAQKVLAFHRWDQGGPADDVVVIANFSNNALDEYTIGFPANGHWTLRFNSDWHGYSELFKGHPSSDINTIESSRDALPFQASLSIAPYSVLIYSQYASLCLLGDRHQGSEWDAHRRSPA